jgi:hypothetical protein
MSDDIDEDPDLVERRWGATFDTREQAEKVANDMAEALDTKARVVEIRPAYEVG